jgi:hypothetical protein
MAHLIDKDALVAEIERRRKLVSDPILSGNDLMIGERNALFNLLSFIDTLEVKEVDFEKEYAKYSNDIDAEYAFPIDLADFKEFAKHFFELGLNAQKGE